jgi:hypothetical protein
LQYAGLNGSGKEKVRKPCFYLAFRTSLDFLELLETKKLVVMGGIEPPTLAL